MQKLATLILIFLLAFFEVSFSQIDDFGFPFLRNYSPEEYIGSNQNWSILQDKKGVMYFGNSPIVLALEGTRWKAIETSNLSVVRSMDIDTSTGIIYVGAQNDFGYLDINSKGQKKYKSLLHLVKPKLTGFNDVWYTYKTNEGVFFISNYVIVRVNNGKCKVWESAEGLFHTAFKIDNKIIIRVRGEGLKIIDGDVLKNIEGSEIFNDARVDFILPYHSNFILGSRNLGLYTIQFNFLDKFKPHCTLEKVNTNADNFLQSNEITRAIKLTNGNYAIGTIKGGAIILNEKLDIISIIDDNIGLQDLKVSYLYEDAQSNLWLALDKGISCVEINSSFRNLTSQNGLKGTVKSMLRFNEAFFFATSQGLYEYRKGDKILKQILEKPIETWDINEFKNINGEKSILAATSNGLIQIANGKQLKISDNFSYKILQSKKFKNLVYVGLYHGFETFKFIDEKWVSQGILSGLDGEVLDIDEDDYGNLWLCTKIDGLRYLKNLNKIGDYPKFEIIKYDEEDGLPTNSDNFIYKFKNKFVVNTTQNQLFKIVTVSKNGQLKFNFIRDTIIDSNFYKNHRYIYKLSLDKNENIWMQTYCDDLLKFENGVALLDKSNHYNWYCKPFKRLKEIQFMSILAEPNGVTWFAGYEGAISYNKNIFQTFDKPFKAVINYIISNKDTIFFGEYYNRSADKFTTKNLNVLSLKQNENQKSELPFQNNNLAILFGATSFITSENNTYSYYLEGNDEEWSDWSKKNEKYYTNLTEGKYIFHLRAKDIFENTSEVITYEFTILPPWYRTIIAYILYIISGIVAVYLIVKFYTKSLKRIIDSQTSELRQQNKEIEHKNKEITDSIFYAKKIQEAIMPSAAYISELYSESFVLFKPKDIVSGDFYWATQKGNNVLLAAADCTGHGVPGAFMSMLGNDNLNEVIIDRNTIEPSKILEGARIGIIKALKQKGESGENKDGMDISMIAFDKDTSILQYAGANNPLYIIRNNSKKKFSGYDYNLVKEKYSLLEIKGNKFPVGIYINNELPPFTNHSLQLETGDSIYVFSDGYADQFGGENGKKFKYNQLKEILLSIQDMPMKKQYEVLLSSFEKWRGNLEQVDDVLLIGLKV